MLSEQIIEAVTQRVKKLRRLEENVTKTLSAKVNELSEECFKVISQDCGTVSTMVTFRLDCYAEFLQNLLIRVKDATQEMESGEDKCKYPIGLKSISSLVERMEKLELALQVKDGSTQESRIQELQFKVDNLTQITEQQRLSLKENNQTVQDLNTELNSLKQQLEVMDGEKKSAEGQLKDELERGRRARQALRGKLRKNSTQQKSLKKALSQIKTENKETSKVVAKKLYNLEMFRDSLNQLTQQAQRGPNTLGAMSCSSVGFSTSVYHRENEVIYVQPNSFISTQLQIDHNVGDCFKQSLGHFVAPQWGLYVFYVSVKPQVDSAANDFRLCLMSKSGGATKPRQRLHVAENARHSTLCVLELQKDALVYLFCSTGGKVDILNFCGFSIS